MSAFKPIIEINGVVDTKNSVFENLQNIATSSQSFLTWDPSKGQWSINLNRELAGLPGSAAKHFDDDNIVGGINVSGTGISDLYNGVRVSFPNRELRGDRDESFYEVQQSERFANETDNVMSISYNLLDDKIQADRMAQLELKQNRVDKVIEFFTDYRAIGLKASDIITVTNEVYDFTNKAFRIVSIEETDSDDGGILLKIVGIEYDVDVYNTSGLTAPERNKNTGIVPSSTNLCVIEKDAELAGARVGQSLGTARGLSSITRESTYGTTSVSIPLFQTEPIGFDYDDVDDVFELGTTSKTITNLDVTSVVENIFVPNGTYTNLTAYTSTGTSVNAIFRVVATSTLLTIFVDHGGDYAQVGETITISTGLGGGSISVDVSEIDLPALVGSFVTYRPIKNCLVLIEAPQGDLTYTVDGTQKTVTQLGIPCTATVYERPFNTNSGQGEGDFTAVFTRYLEWSTYVTSINLSADTTKEFKIVLRPLNTYDLNASTPLISFDSATNFLVNGNDDYVTFTIMAFLK